MPRRTRPYASLHLHTLDDAGDRRELATFGSGDVPDLAHPVARGALARLGAEAAARRAGSPRVAIGATVAISVALMVVAIVLVTLVLRSIRGSPGTAAMVAFLSFATVFAATIVATMVGRVIYSRSMRGASDLIVDALLRMCRCASCGYPLEPDPSKHGEIVRCPECGAAWREGRLGTAAVPVAAAHRARGMRAIIFTIAMSRTRRRDARGRPWVEPNYSHLGVDPSTPSERIAARRLQRSAIMLLLLIIPGIALMLVGPLLLGRGAFAVAWSLGSIAITAVVIVLSLRRVYAQARTFRLRRRTCPACGERMRRERELLVCGNCDGAWRRPRKQSA